MDDNSNKPTDNNIVNDVSINASAPNLHKLVSPGILLFVDQLLIAAGGWIYWLIISKLATTSEIGHATTIYSLVLLINTITQLGFEYPLLKKSITHRDRIFGTALLLELAITATSIPLVIYLASSLYQESLQLAWLAVGILIFSSAGFITRFALLGLSNAKAILVFDIIGTIVKFTSAIFLVSSGYGSTGILISFFLQALVILIGTLIPIKKELGFRLGDIKFAKDIMIDGLVNLPSKLSNMLIVSLSVILLAFFGIDNSQIGIFYMAMMASIVVGSFASSLAFMSIPASSASKTDLSSGSLRIGLAFTAPIIAILIVAPQTILSAIGKEYVAASDVLVILALGVIPSVVISNAMSKFNSQNKPKKLLVIGLLRVGIFLIAFFALTPQYKILGTAYSILISFAVAALVSLIWSDRSSLKFAAIASLSVFAGITAGLLTELLANGEPMLTISTSLIAAFAIMFKFRCISTREIKWIVNSVLAK